jgi:hypothetical protein
VEKGCFREFLLLNWIEIGSGDWRHTVHLRLVLYFICWCDITSKKIRAGKIQTIVKFIHSQPLRGVAELRYKMVYGKSQLKVRCKDAEFSDVR